MLDDQWISTDPRTRKLLIRFRVRGFSKQFCISTGLKDTKRNREIVRSKRDAIANDIALERFDPTLESYRFRAAGKNPAVAIGNSKSKKRYEYDLLDLWSKFTDYQETQIEQTTILSRYVSVLRYTKRLPTQSLEEAPKIRDWLVNNTTKLMAWLLVNHYSQCCEWAVNSHLVPDNPFENLKMKEPQRKSTGEDYRAFTLEQRDLIIQIFDHHPKYSHYSSLIKFLFWTGCRHGEAFALTWRDISKDCCQISINKSCNSYRILKSTKNGVKRVFPTEPGSRLQNLLLELRPSHADSSTLIFTDRLGNALSSQTLQKIWQGQTSKGYHYSGAVKDLVSKGQLPYYLKPYATRHTFATWAITKGNSPDKVAKWIGDTVETVLRYYCHPQVVNAECPDF
ncbi:tyrosine-type recombinase/integrase [Nostoc sp. NMS4]|uniref:tyrosine-type recombinase/integrase n=1 Tax=Nostoc sp. NMS4 TaxID=2815390 RepID=UPI0025D3DD2E|nr:tyrosine-type recombinase/integrase [Nostoc sp. NMS4]MBN3924028.1 tyrosine-type recombinase/integrase [Nostoc sp. NMS4]